MLGQHLSNVCGASQSLEKGILLIDTLSIALMSSVLIMEKANMHLTLYVFGIGVNLFSHK